MPTPMGKDDKNVNEMLFFCQQYKQNTADIVILIPMNNI